MRAPSAITAEAREIHVAGCLYQTGGFMSACRSEAIFRFAASPTADAQLNPLLSMIRFTSSSVFAALISAVVVCGLTIPEIRVSPRFLRCKA